MNNDRKSSKESIFLWLGNVGFDAMDGSDSRHTGS